MFGAEFDVLRYDLTSTYVEGAAEKNPMVRRGYSRDHLPDCEQLVIALIVNHEGFPVSYETFDGNRSDVSTMETGMRIVERKYGKARRIWIFDRGIVSEENLAAIRKRFFNSMETALKGLAKAIATGRLKDRNKMERRWGKIEAWHPQGNDLYDLALRDTAEGVRLFWGSKKIAGTGAPHARALKSRPAFGSKPPASGVGCGPADVAQEGRCFALYLESANIVLPTTDGRQIRLRRISEPTAEPRSLFWQPASVCRSTSSSIANGVQTEL